jgi:S-methylmethionine-dependent homocysteine/selenocysteine methylase
LASAGESLRRRFERGRLLLDGATGTELERRGVPCVLPLWSAGALRGAAEVVQAIHRDYVRSGADIITANTFRTNPRTLAAAGLAGEGAELNRVALELARAAVGGRDVLVAASVAPAEDCYHPERVPAESELRSEHELFMTWLAAAGPDLVWIETMNNVGEARSAARSAAAAGLPLAVSFVVAETGELLSGEPLEAGVAAIEEHDPLAIGLNCVPPTGMRRLLPRLRRATNRPVAAYAHIGNPVPIRGWSIYESPTPAEYAERAREWLEEGAQVVGGCCGTTPEHISAIRQVL